MLKGIRVDLHVERSIFPRKIDERGGDIETKEKRENFMRFYCI